MDDIELKVRQKLGDEVEEDASCDSDFMLTAMNRVGKAICEKYYWIPNDQKCYLVMDNAGGHGSNTAIATYKKKLEDDHNIEIIFQIPRSPYNNVLDLGVWMALQAQVERQHYLQRCNVNTLVNTVMRTWNEGHLDHAITKVFLRLKNVLCNIIEAKGGNDLAESKRGKKFENIKIEDILKNIHDDEDNPIDLLGLDEDGLGETEFDESDILNI